MVSPMRAFTLDEFDSPPRLRDDLPEPALAPGDGELLVRVQASSANPVDNAIAAGMLNGHGRAHVPGHPRARLRRRRRAASGPAVSGYARRRRGVRLLTARRPRRCRPWQLGRADRSSPRRSDRAQARRRRERPTPARRRWPASPRSTAVDARRARRTGQSGADRRRDRRGRQLRRPARRRRRRQRDRAGAAPRTRSTCAGSASPTSSPARATSPPPCASNHPGRSRRDRSTSSPTRPTASRPTPRRSSRAGAARRRCGAAGDGEGRANVRATADGREPRSDWARCSRPAR